MKKHLILLLFLIGTVQGFSQIETPGLPLSMQFSLSGNIPVIQPEIVTGPAIKSFVDQYPENLKSLIFAYPVPVSISSHSDGIWERTPDGQWVWRITIQSPGAFSLNLIFNRFDLPPEGKMFLYTPDYRVIRGAFTEHNELPSGTLATIPLPGESITVEVNLPAWFKRNPLVEIQQVGHDFKGAFAESSVKNSGSCNVDINCPAGNDWQTEKRAVVKFIRGGAWLCTGTLINNTANDGRPLLLTANHCIGLDWHAEQSVFYFRYEKPGCATGSGSLQYSLSGCRLLATTNKVDFSLVELSSEPPKSYDPYYAGWDRRIVSYWDTVTCIHHPSGDVKKISKSLRRVVTGDFGGGFDTNTHWKISQWDIGTTEGGSSGSGLFNADHRIIGDLTGGDASCDYNYNDYFQKFSVSWDRYPDSSNQLKYWLDPDKTGVEILNGCDPFAGGKPLANFEIRPTYIEKGKKVYFTDKSTGVPQTWEWSVPGGTPETLTGSQPVPVIFNEPGQYTVTLKIANALGRDSVKLTLKVFDWPQGVLSENRVVPGRTVVLSDQSSQTPLSVNWTVTGANPSKYVGAGPVELSLTSPGEFSTEQIVEFAEFIDTLVHFNRIKVIQDNIAFKSRTFTNVEPSDHTGFISMGTQGYFPGSNSLGIGAYAETFRNTTDTAYMITGLTFHLERISRWAANYYLPVVIWNSQRQPVLRDSVKIGNIREDSKITVWFKSPVKFDTVVYAGYEVRPWDQGTFYSRMAVDRGNRGINTASAIKGSQWSPMTDIAGVHTSLDVQLETAYLRNSYDEEISIVPNGNFGEFTLDLGKLVFKSVLVDVYSLTGQKLVSQTERTENLIRLRVLPPVSGIYLVRITLDELSLTKKVLVIRKP